MTSPVIVGTATSADSSSTSYTCAKPTGVVSGHLLLAMQFSAGTIGTVPSGWTTLQSQSSGLTSRIAFLAAGGSEPSTYTFTQTADPGGAIIIAYSGALLTTPISATTTAGSGSNISTPSITPGASDDVDVRFAIAIASPLALNPPAGWTSQESNAPDSNHGSLCATKTLASSAPTGVQDFTSSFGTPTVRHGYTVDVTALVVAARRAVFVGTSAVQRAASW